jgi:plastocyanin
VSRRALFLAATLFAVLGLAVAACGSDDDGEAAEPPAEQPAEPAPPAEEPPAEEPPAEEPPAEATELQLATDPGGGLTFDQTELSAAPGTVSIVLTNDSPVPHNVAIEGNGVDVEGEVFQGGGTRTTEAELAAGDYVFYCSVPGHREAGMEGTLTVG